MDRILIINPFGIGDVLFTTPLIANLRLAYPNAKITYLANRRTADILQANPQIAQVVVYERDEFVAVYQRNPLAFVKKWMDLGHQIKQEGFDVVFDFSMNGALGFLTLAAGVKERIGFDYKGRGRLVTRRISLSGYEGRDVVEYYLDLLTFIGVPVVERTMSLTVSPKDAQWALDWLKAKGLDGKTDLIAMIPGGGASWGAGAKNKRWPAAKYAQLADKIIAKTKAAIILMGDLKEEALCEELAREVQSPVFSAVGQTSVLQMAALMRHCRLVIVNDGGPLHIAVASGVKTVSIFGPVDPMVYGPYPKEGHGVIQKGLPCQPCYRKFRMAQCNHVSCLNDLSIDDVYRKVESLL